MNSKIAHFLLLLPTQHRGMYPLTAFNCTPPLQISSIYIYIYIYTFSIGGTIALLDCKVSVLSLTENNEDLMNNDNESVLVDQAQDSIYLGLFLEPGCDPS